jgi:hypothetical protein
VGSVGRAIDVLYLGRRLKLGEFRSDVMFMKHGFIVVKVDSR